MDPRASRKVINNLTTRESISRVAEDTMLQLDQFLRPTYQLPTTADNDPRLAQLMLPAADWQSADVVLMGAPTDEGVIRNGGRPGQSAAPTAIRTALSKLTPFAGPKFRKQLTDLRIADIGDIKPGNLEAMHDVLRATTATLRSAGKIAIILGGGHDITYPAAAGIRDGASGIRDGASGIRDGATGSFGVINVDTHLDVRPRKNGLHHSGSSFRLLVEDGIIPGNKLVQLGAQSFAMAQAHYEWMQSVGARVTTFEEANDTHLPTAFEEHEFLLTLGQPSAALYLSFDMDAVRAADAPGVSAPTPTGFLAEEVYELAVAAGLSPMVCAFDIAEVNPTYDIDNRTAKLAARMIAGFLAGVANRNH